MKLTQISNNDVKSTRERIINLREAAKVALEAARQANNRALDLKVPNEIPEFSDETQANILKSADDINETANVSFRIALCGLITVKTPTKNSYLRGIY